MGHRPERLKGTKKDKSSRPDGPKAGPKGHKLEVGAQPGPRLLVNNKALETMKEFVLKSRAHDVNQDLKHTAL